MIVNAKQAYKSTLSGADATPVIVYCPPVDTSGAEEIAKQLGGATGLSTYVAYQDGDAEHTVSDLSELLRQLKNENKPVILVGGCYGCHVIDQVYAEDETLFSEVKRCIQVDPPRADYLSALEASEQNALILKVLNSLTASLFDDCKAKNQASFTQAAAPLLKEKNPTPINALAAINKRLVGKGKTQDLQETLQRIFDLYHKTDSVKPCPPNTVILRSEDHLVLFNDDYNLSEKTGVLYSNIKSLPQLNHAEALKLQSEVLIDLLAEYTPKAHYSSQADILRGLGDSAVHSDLFAVTKANLLKATTEPKGESTRPKTPPKEMQRVAVSTTFGALAAVCSDLDPREVMAMLLASGLMQPQKRSSADDIEFLHSSPRGGCKSAPPPELDSYQSRTTLSTNAT